jgi:hypothetical protein
MNYEPNTTQWQKGDIVIHDADAKEACMLMRVIGYTRDGLCKTKYVDKSRKRTVWKNGIEFLHDPARFGIVTTRLDAEAKMRKELEALSGVWADLPIDEEWLEKVRTSLDERVLRLISWL